MNPSKQKIKKIVIRVNKICKRPFMWLAFIFHLIMIISCSKANGRCHAKQKLSPDITVPLKYSLSLSPSPSVSLALGFAYRFVNACIKHADIKMVNFGHSLALLLSQVLGLHRHMYADKYTPNIAFIFECLHLKAFSSSWVCTSYQQQHRFNAFRHMSQVIA